MSEANPLNPEPRRAARQLSANEQKLLKLLLKSGSLTPEEAKQIRKPDDLCAAARYAFGHP